MTTNLSATSDVTSMQVRPTRFKVQVLGAYSCVGMQITVVRSGSSCPLGEVLEHSERVGPGGGVAYIYIYTYIIITGCV